MFIITYDENGGFYDHVPPPGGVPSPDGIDCFDCSPVYDFTSLGIRVPTIAISPYIKRGTVVGKGTSTKEPSSDVIFDSTSVMSTTNELLGVSAPPLGERMAWAPTFSNLISDTLRDDCPELLPELPPTPDNIAEVQRAKVINEHMHAALLFFCSQNYPEEFVVGELCKSSVPHALNQGTASDWMKVEQENFMHKSMR